MPMDLYVFISIKAKVNKRIRSVVCWRGFILYLSSAEFLDKEGA